jgi:hypothetical protein
MTPGLLFLAILWLRRQQIAERLVHYAELFLDVN